MSRRALQKWDFSNTRDALNIRLHPSQSDKSKTNEKIIWGSEIYKKNAAMKEDSRDEKYHDKTSEKILSSKMKW